MSVKRYDYGYQDGYSADGMTGLQFADDGALVKYEDYAALEARCAALAAENAGLKSYASDCVSAVEHWNSWADAEDKISTTPETPATDAFLAEVKAQGVEMLARETEKLEWHESTVRFVLKFAAQIRKGVQS